MYIWYVMMKLIPECRKLVSPEVDVISIRPDDAKVAATTIIINVFQETWNSHHTNR